MCMLVGNVRYGSVSPGHSNPMFATAKKEKDIPSLHPQWGIIILKSRIIVKKRIVGCEKMKKLVVGGFERIVLCGKVWRARGRLQGYALQKYWRAASTKIKRGLTPKCWLGMAPRCQPGTTHLRGYAL